RERAGPGEGPALIARWPAPPTSHATKGKGPANLPPPMGRRRWTGPAWGLSAPGPRSGRRDDQLGRVAARALPRLEGAGRSWVVRLRHHREADEVVGRRPGLHPSGDVELVPLVRGGDVDVAADLRAGCGLRVPGDGRLAPARADHLERRRRIAPPRPTSPQP